MINGRRCFKLILWYVNARVSYRLSNYKCILKKLIICGFYSLLLSLSLSLSHLMLDESKITFSSKKLILEIRRKNHFKKSRTTSLLLSLFLIFIVNARRRALDHHDKEMPCCYLPVGRNVLRSQRVSGKRKGIHKHEKDVRARGRIHDSKKLMSIRFFQMDS